MDQQQSGTALAEREQQQGKIELRRGEHGDAQDLTVIGVQQALSRPGLERIEAVVVVPADFQYGITKWIDAAKVRPDQVVVNRGDYKVEVIDKIGLTIDGYDYINRVMGVSFFLPEWVHDEHGEQKRNPIHRKDYIYLRLAAVWYSPLGQLMYASEDVEVDFRLSYMESRATAKSAKPRMVDGQVAWSESGDPIIEVSPEDELKALKQFSTQRNFGPRYAQSVARVRLLKQATGIRSLPISEPQAFPLKIVGYRDQMTAQQRIQQVTSDAAPLYGRPDDIKPLSAAEMAEAGIEENDTETDVDREAVERAQEPAAEAAEAGPAVEPVPAATPAAEPVAAAPEPQADDATQTEPTQSVNQQTAFETDDGLPPMR